MNNLKNIMIPLIALIIFGLFWEWLVFVNGWPNYKMASPSDLWPAFWKFRWLFLSYGWETLWRTVVGLSLSVLVGVGFGVIMGFSKTMRIALYPLLVGFNAIPKATVVPVIALMFVGMHDMNTILIVILISFFPIHSIFPIFFKSHGEIKSTYFGLVIFTGERFLISLDVICFL